MRDCIETDKLDSSAIEYIKEVQKLVTDGILSDICENISTMEEYCICAAVAGFLLRHNKDFNSVERQDIFILNHATQRVIDSGLPFGEAIISESQESETGPNQSLLSLFLQGAFFCINRCIPCRNRSET
ncbi:uncharacterized protein LOC126318196 [Schistocerca gregaria]|uniref:uncharacterized protein LOC126318196 n=1 Tax=Schistocerca gregaria TaxID=7010 RepID=UPI00211DB689|nr:uncharacterized protein LOC126318196 [Schistocerca gregaria]